MIEGSTKSDIAQMGGTIHVLDGRFSVDGPSSKTIDAGDRLVTPGLVDCHTHLVWAGERSSEFVRRCAGEHYLSIAKSGGGILATMRATRDSSVEELCSQIVARAALLLSFGTTTVEVKASYGLSVDACKRELDAIQLAKGQVEQELVVTFMGAHTFPPDCERDFYMQLLCEELIPMAASHPVGVEFNDVFCEETAFTLDESRKVLEGGVHHGLTPKIHSDEFSVLGATEMACSLGAASCDHLLMSGPTQFSALARSGTVAVTMPSTAFYLNKGFADARSMVDSGCMVALGTDFNPGTSMAPSMPFAMGLAVSRMGLTPMEALRGATTNAAAAIRRKKGTFAIGAPADFCIWPCQTLDQLIYQFAYVRPDEVYIAGERKA